MPSLRRTLSFGLGFGQLEEMFSQLAQVDTRVFELLFGAFTWTFTGLPRLGASSSRPGLILSRSLLHKLKR